MLSTSLPRPLRNDSSALPVGGEAAAGLGAGAAGLGATVAAGFLTAASGVCAADSSSRPSLRSHDNVMNNAIAEKCAANPSTHVTSQRVNLRTVAACCTE